MYSQGATKYNLSSGAPEWVSVKYVIIEWLSGYIFNFQGVSSSGIHEHLDQNPPSCCSGITLWSYSFTGLALLKEKLDSQQSV